MKGRCRINNRLYDSSAKIVSCLSVLFVFLACFDYGIPSNYAVVSFGPHECSQHQFYYYSDIRTKVIILCYQRPTFLFSSLNPLQCFITLRSLIAPP